MKSISIFPLIFFLATSALATEFVNTSVTTLIFPHGTKQRAMGVQGAAYTSGLSSAFYNPSLSALIGKNDNVQFLVDYKDEELLPSLDLDDLWHHTGDFGYFHTGYWDNVDLGIVYTHNRIEFGDVEDDSGLVSDVYEYVNALSIGVTYRDFLSLGLTHKAFYSKLFKDVVAKGGAVFDIGAHIQKKITKDNRIYFKPALGVSFSGLGNDSAQYSLIEGGFGENNPLPREMRFGISNELCVKNYFKILNSFELNKSFREKQKIKNTDGTVIYELYESIISAGLSFSIIDMVHFSNGIMYDHDGKRHEFHKGIEFSFNYYTFTDIFNLPRPIKSNFYFSYGSSVISTRGDNDIRDGQKMHQFTIGGAFIHKNRDKQAVRKRGYQESDGALIN